MTKIQIMIRKYADKHNGAIQTGFICQILSQLDTFMVGSPLHITIIIINIFLSSKSQAEQRPFLTTTTIGSTDFNS